MNECSPKEHDCLAFKKSLDAIKACQFYKPCDSAECAFLEVRQTYSSYLANCFCKEAQLKADASSKF